MEGPAPLPLLRIGSSAAGGRGVFATQPLKPGTEVFSERPAYHTTCAGKTPKQEGIEALAAHIVASHAPQHRNAIAALVSNVTELRKQPDLCEALADAVEHVRKAVELMPIDEALAIVSPTYADGAMHVPEAARTSVRESLVALAQNAVSEESVWLSYGRDWSNAMWVNPGSASRLGSALYPQFGAVMNHSNNPNVYLIFDDDWLLRVRTIAPVAAGEELCFSYVDPGQSYAELRAVLRKKYHFDCGEQDGRGGQRYVPGSSSCDDSRLAELARTYGGVKPPCTEPAALIPAITAALQQRQAAYDWLGIVVASDDLLFCYRFTFRVVHPQVALRLLSAGLACQRLAPSDERCDERASRYLSQAVRVLGVTHGEFHPLATCARRALEKCKAHLPGTPPSSRPGAARSPAVLAADVAVGNVAAVHAFLAAPRLELDCSGLLVRRAVDDDGDGHSTYYMFT
jgi:hypothetical protein